MECLLNINDKYKLYDNVKLLDHNLPLEDYWSYVLDEVEKIKKYFTPEEIQNLIDVHLEDIDGHSANSCIYGTMIGSCFSDRVHEFIFTLPVVVKSNDKLPEETLRFKSEARGTFFLTPLEHYITPLEEEEDEDGVEEYFYTPEYYKRVKKVLNLFK